jgi:hypothetical protein
VLYTTKVDLMNATGCKQPRLELHTIVNLYFKLCVTFRAPVGTAGSEYEINWARGRIKTGAEARRRVGRGEAATVTQTEACGLRDVVQQGLSVL